MLTISAKNFGPIAEGSVDLKPLTIFVGPSNTGKSYMATAVYAVMRGFEGPYHWMVKSDPSSQERGLRTLMLSMSSGRLATARNEGTDGVDALIKWASGLQEDEFGPRQIYFSDMSDELRAELEHSTRNTLNWVVEDIISKIADTCGQPPSFVRRGCNGSDFRINISRQEPLLRLGITLEGYAARQSHDFDLSSTLIRQPYLEPLSNQEILDDDLQRVKHLAEYRFLELVDSATEPVFSGIPRQSFYLPASRSGLTQSYKVLSSSIVRQWSSVRVFNSSRATLPGSTSDFLSNLISLDRRMLSEENTATLDPATSFIETAVLQGKIDLNESSGLPFPEISYETATDKFTIDQTSSMVSELAPLVLFLKYLVRPGDLLILEEPESHLHPAAQLQMARGIARLVNAGVKVLITTHSGDFIGQIDNLLRMSNASEQAAKSLGLEPEECLQPDQVSAYGFRIDSDLGGAVTYPLPVGSDVGIEDEEFLPVSELLYRQALDLEDARLK